MSTPQTPKLWRALASVLLAIFVLCAGLSAQVINGSITGDVKDASGAYVPKANVTVKAPAIGISTHTTTNANGTFFVPSLPPGTYSITVEAQGFKKITKTDIVLSTGDKLSAGEFILQVGAAGESITVEATSAELQIQSNSGERSDLITGKQLNDLAMNGRMIFDYVKILPGVTSTFNGQQSTKGGLDSFNINGARGTQHQLTIDGITNVDNGCNCASQVTINPDAIAEVRVLTSNYQAEYGKAAGGQMAITTKNGTNQFHGNARWFHRHEQFNAWPYFDGQEHSQNLAKGVDDGLTKGKYRYNYVGWQLGGPVVIPGTNFNKNKDKLFFFVNQEFYRQLMPGGTDRVYMPTVDEISGNFSKSTDGHGNPITIIDPTTGNPFPGNIIPANRINKQMQDALLKIYPRPNTTDSVAGWNRYNYISQTTTDDPRREDIARVDYQVNNANRLFARYLGNAEVANLPEGSSPQGISNFMFPGGMVLKAPGYTASLGLTSTVSPTLVNDLNFGWTANWQDINSYNNNVASSKYNLSVPLYYKVSGNTPIPDFSFGGVADQWGSWSYLGSIPWHNSLTSINLTDNLTKSWGRHTLKAGVFFERTRKDQSAWANVNGQYNFSGNDGHQALQTGDPYANALLGYFTSFGQTSVRPRGLFRYTNAEFFLQDTFKLTHRLTLDYGMRFAWVEPQHDKLNRAAFFDPAAYDPAKAVTLASNTTVVPGSGNYLNGIVYAKDGYPKGGFDDRGIMLQPRFGFAWDVFGTNKTVFRGGFGMNHDRFQGNPIYNEVNDNPVTMPRIDLQYGQMDNIAALGAANNTISVLNNVVAWQRDGKVPTVYNFSFSLQQDLGWGTVLDLAYVGSQSRHLSQKYNLNAIPLGTLFTKAAQDPSKFGGVVPEEETWRPQIYKDLGLPFTGANAKQVNYLRPYMGYGDIQYWRWDGDANYNSLQVSANKRFSKNVSFGVAYTYSKSLATSTNDGQWTSYINPKKYNYGLTGFDRPHVFAFNYVVDLPKFSKWMGNSKTVSYFTDGFQLSGITRFMSGSPTMVGGNVFWWSNELFSGSWTEWWNPIVKGNPTAGVKDPYGHVNPDSFYLPLPGSLAKSPQQYLRNGVLNNSDMSIFKNIPLGSESRYLQLRLEAFNVFNHTQFDGLNLDTGGGNPWDSALWNWTSYKLVNSGKVRPNGTTGNIGAYFGEYNSARDPRKLQLAMKLYF